VAPTAGGVIWAEDEGPGTDQRTKERTKNQARRPEDSRFAHHTNAKNALVQRCKPLAERLHVLPDPRVILAVVFVSGAAGRSLEISLQITERR
jgi:hypothetical protein